MRKTKKRGESPLFLLMEISQNKTFWYNKYMYTKNEDELIALGEKLGYLLEKNDVLILTGELGAGKTTLTKGLAKGLDIHQMISFESMKDVYPCITWMFIVSKGLQILSIWTNFFLVQV